MVRCWSDLLQISESWQNHYIWEVCSAIWWGALQTAMPAVSISQQKGPNSSPWQCPTTCCTTNLSKVEWIGLWSFCLIRHIHLTSLTNQLPLLQASWQLFVGKMLPQPAGGRKCFLRVCWILKHGFLCYRNKQAFLGKNILIVMVPILINKDVFEPCYNDLKFKVQNCNYFCTRLITQLEALKKTL